MWAFFRPKKLLALAVLAAIGSAAFYLGRLVGPQKVEAQVPAPPEFPLLGQGDPDYSRRVVATIFGNTPVTREELGEFLIARFGAERLEFLVNRKIVEKACQPHGITVTEAEIEAQLRADLRTYGGPGMTEKMFYEQILRKWNKTLFEWREDVIRPKLMLSKYCRAQVRVTEDDIRKAYEARYGLKVQCRLIVLEKNNRRWQEVWKEVSSSEEKFIKAAKEQMIPELAAKAGLAPPIHKHFGDEKIERAAFRLKPGEVSEAIQLQDGTMLIMRCEAHIPAETKFSMNDVAQQIRRELEDVKLGQAVAETMKKLRDQAAPRLLLTAQQRQLDQDQRLQREVAPNLSGPPSTAVPSPN